MTSWCVCASIIISAFIIRHPLVKIQRSIQNLEINCKELNMFFNRKNK